jgi:hypothetical protein
MTAKNTPSEGASKTTRGRLIEVGGFSGGTGKTMMAANLAVAFSQTGARVLLADMNANGAGVEEEFASAMAADAVENRGLSALIRWVNPTKRVSLSERDVLFFAVEVSPSLWVLPGLNDQSEYEAADASLRRALFSNVGLVDSYVEAALECFDYVVIDKGTSAFTSLGSIAPRLAKAMPDQPAVFVRVFDGNSLWSALATEGNYQSKVGWLPANGKLLHVYNLITDASDLVPEEGPEAVAAPPRLTTAPSQVIRVGMAHMAGLTSRRFGQPVIALASLLDQDDQDLSPGDREVKRRLGQSKAGLTDIRQLAEQLKQVARAVEALR